MLPFSIALVAGESPYRQVVFAVTKAVVSGELLPGTPFPSVRELSVALKINPNTAHKAVAELVRDGLLEVQPGVGTVVAPGKKASARERRTMLAREVEALVVEARRLGISGDDLLDAVQNRWVELFETDGPTRPARGTSND